MNCDELCGNKVVLRLLSHFYFPEYLCMFSPTVRMALHVSDTQSELCYLKERLIKMHDGKTLFYCIFDKQADQLVGGIEIRDDQIHRGQLYSWMNEDFWGGGRYQEALALASQEYFKSFNALFFNAHVDIVNQRSYHALRKFGCAQGGYCNGPNGKQYNLIIRKR